MRRGQGSLYDIAVPGYKANLSDVLASIALCQLDKLERHREIRLRHVAAYDAAVADLEGVEPLARDPRDTHALHLYVVRVDAERAGATRDEYQRALAEEQIGTSIHFLPVHRLTAYRERFPDQPPLPIAERAGDEVLSLPLSPAHSDEDIDDAIAALRRVHAGFTGMSGFTPGPVRSRSAALVVTGLCIAYILWKIDLGETVHVLAQRAARRTSSPRSRSWPGSVWPMAWRWQLLLAARGDPRRPALARPRVLRLRTRPAQVLPTSLGGDASRIYETTKTPPGRRRAVAGSVLLERALGGARRWCSPRSASRSRSGSYDVGGYLWVELAFVVAAIVLGVRSSSRAGCAPLAAAASAAARAGSRSSARSAARRTGHPRFRDDGRLLDRRRSSLTLGVQAVRVLAIWLAGKAVGVDLSPRPYYVMGPLLFLVMLVPFTVNGLARARVVLRLLPRRARRRR